MTTTWYTADFHFGHKNILRHEPSRPWDSVDVMDRELVARFNDRVQENDSVYILGDLSLGSLTNALSWVEKMNGIKTFIPGNHDECWIGSKRFQKYLPRYEDAGLEVQQGPVPHFLGTKRVWMSHFPAQCDFRRQVRNGKSKDFDYEPDRFAPYRPQGPTIHGHVHSMWKKRGTDVNVGVDVWDWFPVDAQTISALFDSDYND